MASSRQINTSAFSDDILAFIRLLEEHQVRYVIVGGEAVIFYGYPRLTGDVDFFYDKTEPNAQRLFNCLADFWEGNIPEVANVADLMEEGVVIQFGRPPYRLDLLNCIDAVVFEEAWSSRETVQILGGAIPMTAQYLGKEALLKNKRASGRLKDLDDIQHLE